MMSSEIKAMLLDLESESDSDDEVVSRVFSVQKSWITPYVAERSEYGEFHTLFTKLNDVQFQNYLRMRREQFFYIHNGICEQITKQDMNYRKAIGTVEKVAVCLRYLASGDSFKSLEYSYRLGHRTVSNIVVEVCDAIWDTFQSSEMPEPTAVMLKKSADNFKTKWNFDHCIGALDGKHCLMKAPPNSGSSYFNYKKTFSIVLLALVDADYRFQMIDVGSMGRFSDGGIFSSSFIGNRIRFAKDLPPDEPLFEGGEPIPYVVVGDEAFPLLNHLMRPYPGRNLAEDQSIFNGRLSRARRVSENAFGILSARWRIFRKPFEIKVENVDKVVKAACVLHNFLTRGENIPLSIAQEHQEATRMQRVPMRATTEAQRIRDRFKNYFMSPEGEVSWQARYYS